MNPTEYLVLWTLAVFLSFIAGMFWAERREHRQMLETRKLISRGHE